MAGEKVLVVDAKKDVAERHKGILEAFFGFECDVCTDENAEIITAKVSVFNPDAIIMDCLHTPGVSSEKLLRQIKKEHPAVIIVLYTSPFAPLRGLCERLVKEDVAQQLFFKPSDLMRAGKLLQALF